MKAVFDHIDRIKEKPHHVRKRIAFGVAGTGAGLVGLVWLVASVSTGAFEIQGTNFAESTGQESFSQPSGETQNLAGVSAALDNAHTAARIEIVTVGATSTKTQAERTTIPF